MEIMLGTWPCIAKTSGWCQSGIVSYHISSSYWFGLVTWRHREELSLRFVINIFTEWFYSVTYQSFLVLNCWNTSKWWLLQSLYLFHTNSSGISINNINQGSSPSEPIPSFQSLPFPHSIMFPCSDHWQLDSIAQLSSRPVQYSEHWRWHVRRSGKPVLQIPCRGL